MRKWFAVLAAALVCLCWHVPVVAAGDQPVTVWNGDINDPDDGAPGDGPPVIAIVGTRNGSFSGKVVVGSASPIEGLKAAVSDLKQGAATIPTDRLHVRYAAWWDLSIGSHYRPPGADILLKSPPEQFPVQRGGKAVAPVWLTVDVPKDAAPGTYTGRLTVEARGMRPVAIPVKLDVGPWTLPETQDWRTWMDIYESPDTLVTEYGIPRWSDEHWAMIAKAMRLIGGTGSRVLYVPLICQTNRGNEESMVRWIDKGETFDYDFSIMDRYLDTAEKNMGRPKLVVFYAWEISLKPPKEEIVITEDDSRYQAMEKSKWAARWKLRDKGPGVTMLDPATGKTEMVRVPRYTDPESKALWKPLWDQLRERMRKRGLEDTMMIGVASDHWPSKDEVAFFNEVAPDLLWVTCSHHARWVIGEDPKPTGQLYRMASVGYSQVALDHQFTINPAQSHHYGWKKPFLHAQYWRFAYFNTSSLTTVRHEPERNITGNQRGLARIGGDFWYAVKDRRGRPVGPVSERYPESYWHSLNVHNWILAPGKDGPVATRRYEVLREGLQECEARIFIEDALTNDALRAKLGNDLADRVQAVLDERHMAMWRARGLSDANLQIGFMEKYREYYALVKGWNAKAGNKWFVESGWPARTAKLYAAAAAVAAELGK